MRYRDSSLLAIATRQARALAAADGTKDASGIACALFEVLRTLDAKERHLRIAALIDAVLEQRTPPGQIRALH